MLIADITADEARQAVHYDPCTGEFRWFAKTRPGLCRALATKMDRDGYLKVNFGRKSYKAHRLAWLYVHGEWPAEEIDHINGIRSDNRIANLRPASHAENAQNRCIPRNNTSGYQGVTRRARTGKWRAQIASSGKRRTIGEFDTPEAAYAAYLDAKAALHHFQRAPRDGAEYGAGRKRRVTR